MQCAQFHEKNDLFVYFGIFLFILHFLGKCAMWARKDSALTYDISVDLKIKIAWSVVAQNIYSKNGLDEKTLNLKEKMTDR